MNDLSRQATRLEAIEGSYDKWLLGAIIALTGVGVVMVASSSIALMSSPFYYLNRHLIFLAVGIVLAVIAARTELKSIEQYNQMLLLGCFVLLLAVFAPGLGSTVNGARRWINLGISKFQTVEAVKVLYIVWLSSYLVRFRDEVNATWPAMLKPLGVAGALVVLLLLQPDFGSSTLLLAITAGMLVLGGVNMPRMSMPVIIGLVGMSALAIIEPYRMRRITSFLDPWADQQGDGYQLSNALMAVGRGEWTGVGLGNSVQKLYYLPEAHTDFIFSVTAEELGFVGTCLIVALYALLAPLLARYFDQQRQHSLAQRARGSWRHLATVAVVCGLLGPGLIIEGIFKNQMGRPRPVQVVEFGGTDTYQGPFVPGKTPERNRSFVSSHAAAGFWLMSLGLTCGPLWRRRWLLIGIVAGGVVGLGRMLQGGHFFSDILFAFFTVWLSCEIVAWLDKRRRSRHT